MGHQDWEEDSAVSSTKLSAHEFECPECDANNPYDDGIAPGDEVICYYCGLHFLAKEKDGRLRFKEV